VVGIQVDDSGVDNGSVDGLVFDQSENGPGETGPL
jgi:hypothetical protein